MSKKINWEYSPALESTDHIQLKDQYNLFINELLSYGLEFDYDYKNSTTFRFIINHIDNAEFKQSSFKFNNIYSYGLGFRIKSLLGPFNFMWTYTKEPILNLEQKNYLVV